ncbi:MAG: hypothetical protein ABI333_00740 [bacterium]
MRSTGALLTAILCAAAIVFAGCGDDDSGGNNQTGGDSGTVDAGVQADGGGQQDASAQADGGGPQPGPGCPALDPPNPATENIIPVDTSSDLPAMVNAAQSGDTFVLADGNYALGGAYLWISSPNVTIRSASGNREAVVLDDDYSGTEIITIAASNVTVADITIREAYTHPIHVVSTDTGSTVGTLIYNVHLIDPREQAIKINPNAGGYFPDDGVIACSHLELTDVGRPNVNPTSGGCYTGGVDGHQARGWVIRDNVFQGFWCDTGLSEHAVHCWRGCRDTVVERNVMIDNARGVGFGLATSGEARTFTDDPCPGVSGYVGHYGGIVRNNFIFVGDPDLLASPDGFDCGICFWSACYARALHNTIVSTGGNFSSIEWRFDTAAGVEITNNIVTHPLRERDGASAAQAGNLESAPLSLFEDGAGGDLHLAPGAAAAIDQGVAVAAGLCDDDIDGQVRDSSPDIGADEYSAP